MDVDAAEPRSVEHIAPKDAPVRDDERDVGSLRAHPLGEVARLQLRGLYDRQPELVRADLHGGGGQHEATSRGLVRLADDADDLCDGVCRLERRHRERG